MNLSFWSATIIIESPITNFIIIVIYDIDIKYINTRYITYLHYPFSIWNKSAVFDDKIIEPRYAGEGTFPRNKNSLVLYLNTLQQFKCFCGDLWDAVIQQ